MLSLSGLGGLKPSLWLQNTWCWSEGQLTLQPWQASSDRGKESWCSWTLLENNPLLQPPIMLNDIPFMFKLKSINIWWLYFLHLQELLQMSWFYRRRGPDNGTVAYQNHGTVWYFNGICVLLGPLFIEPMNNVKSPEVRFAIKANRRKREYPLSCHNVTCFSWTRGVLLEPTEERSVMADLASWRSEAAFSRSLYRPHTIPQKSQQKQRKSPESLKSRSSLLVFKHAAHRLVWM